MKEGKKETWLRLKNNKLKLNIQADKKYQVLLLEDKEK